MNQGALFSESRSQPAPARIAHVAVELPVSGTFDYRIPGRLKDQVKPGVRVWVSFSGRRVMGICLAISDTSSIHDPLEILGALDVSPLLSEKLLELVQWMSGYYHCPLGEVFSAALPSGARRGSRSRKVHAARLKIPLAEAYERAGQLLSKNSKQARVLRILADAGGSLPVKDLSSRANVSRSPIQTLHRQGIVDIHDVDRAEPCVDPVVEAFPKPERLSPEQDQALRTLSAAVEKEEGKHFLLYGVTGSGKTEIYLRAIEAIIERGKGAIVLVPEISLTPQTIARFKGRFDRVAVLHSRLTDRERFDQWKQIQSGDADVVVGARSAVFAPMPNLGLIVVDEEHETSFKQQNAPPYHARTVALKRADIEGAIALFGSATPSLESFRQACEGKVKPLQLRERVGGGRFPAVSIVDMNLERTSKGSFLSEALRGTLDRTLRDKKQAILFLNRRGYYTVLLCGACKKAVRCEQCDISLTLHRKAHRLICHYCGFEMLPPEECPSCGSRSLKYIGTGTERVEHEVRTLFPEAALLRMDSDTMVGRKAHEKALDRFKTGEVDVLIGTQMIAKGLDFPSVTLVGVVSADTPLYQPDFRSSERAFQLLSQVAGRAGRGPDGGRVIVQTYNPNHFSIQCAVKNDYPGFARTEARFRKEAGYPPFHCLLRAVFSGENKQEVEDMTREAAAILARQSFGEGSKILGPAKAPISMISGRYRWHLLAKSPRSENLDAVAAQLIGFNRKARRARSRSIRMILDMDPVSML